MRLPRRFPFSLCVLAALLLVPSVELAAQPATIYGIHDDMSNVNEWTSRCPSGQSWITATEAIGSNPYDYNGKAYNPPSGSKIIARLNNDYFPGGTIPRPASYDNFATRCGNFVAASSNCDTWLIGNETNLAVEWPNDGAGNLDDVTPEDYAVCFKKCYVAIKNRKPNDKVLVQALAPWAGPFGSGSVGGYSHPAQNYNWCDYMYRMMVSITTGTDAVTPDGIATHINSRGWTSGALADGPWVNAGNLTLDFSWGVRRDWVQFGLPRNLWNLPLYATESNGLYFWKGGGPESSSDPAYSTGWIQQVYSDVNAWNQNAKSFAMPIYRCVNMYRWCSWCDGWNIDNSPQEGTILNDLSSAAGSNYTWPSFGGNALSPGTPSGSAITSGITASADSVTGTDTAAKAFDGNTSTKWASTNAAKTHWLQADLGSARTINGYIVRHASGAGESTNFNTVGFQIQVAASSSGPWSIHTLVRTNTPYATAPPSATALSYATPISARYIRLYVNDPCIADDYARIPEFEIYGPATGTETIIDNAGAGFSVISGTWSTSSYSPGYYGTNYRYANTITGSATAVCRFTPTGLSGAHEVFTWYVAGSNRAADAQYRVKHASGTATVNVNQTINGSQWVSLGSYTLDSTSYVELTNSSATSGKVAIADAARFLASTTPTATPSPSPSPSPSPTPSPSPSPTPSPTPTLTPSPSPTPAGDYIVDNPSASFTGTWNTGTSATDKYGSDYRFATSGSGATATFNANVSAAGTYRVSVWYPAGSNRSNNAPCTVNFSGGSLTYSVNQQSNGGQWNVLGSHYFAAGGGQVVIGTTGANPSVVLADAVRFEFLNGNAPVTVTYESIAAEDGYTLESGENTSVGGASSATGTVLPVGDYSSAKKQWITILSFDTSGVPDGATIQKVTLKLTQYSINTADPWLTLGTCVVDLKSPYLGTSSALANQDFESAVDASEVATVPKPSGNNVTVNAVLNSAGVLLTNKTGKTQMKVRFTIDDDNDTANDYVNFYSANHATTAYRPKLEIQYAQ